MGNGGGISRTGKEATDDIMGHLTLRALPGLAKKPGRHPDGDGLILRVLDAERRYWSYRFRLNGREGEFSLGPYPQVGLDEARRRHAQARAQVLTGQDPLAAKRAKKAIAAAASAPDAPKPTFGEIAADHVETHERSWRNAKHRQQWRNTLASYCGAIHGLPVDRVDTPAVLSVLKPIWTAKPETASRLRGRIEVILNAARALGHIDADKANPARWKGHLDQLLPKRKRLTRGHHAALDYREMPAFITRLREIEGTSALALEFLILTCTRTNETLGARWGEIDEVALWTIPASRAKIGKAHQVPLSARALAILKDARSQMKREPDAEAFVFPGVKRRRPLSNMAFLMLLRRMKVDVTAHGFRSSARSWMGDTGVEFEVAEQCLGHTVGNAVTQAYLRTTMVERRRPVMQAWADYLEGEEPAGAEVVPMREAAAAV
jgi:integrase